MNGYLTRCFTLLAFFCMAASYAFAGGGHDHGHGHGHDEHEEVSRGPHGGRLLTEGDFGLEITIFEKDTPPEFRLFPTFEGHPATLADVKAVITLTRFGDVQEVFEFAPQENYLSSEKIVSEPHSFEVAVTAEHAGKKYAWKFESFEGRTRLSPSALKTAQISIEAAGPEEILSMTTVYGRLLLNEDRVAHLSARFPGIVKQVHKKLGDVVAKGEVVAVIESNQSLQPYEIRSQLAGTVIKRHASLGEYVGENRELFVVADTSEVWADFQVYRDDFGPIREGQTVLIDLGSGAEPIPAKVSYVSPVTDISTQSKLVRAVLPNPEGALRPGLFVSGVLSKAQTRVPVAVHREAIQTFRDWDVVFLSDGHTFQAMPVELGLKDSRFVEIVSGIKAGDRYVSKNSFIIKADIEKSGASHDH